MADSVAVVVRMDIALEQGAECKFLRGGGMEDLESLTRTLQGSFQL